MSKVTILGAGGWGMALACALSSRGHEVFLWSLFEQEVAALREHRGNEALLPGVTLPDAVEVTGDLAVAATSDVVVLAVPSFAVRSTAALLKGVVPDGAIVVNVGKGFEKGTLKRLSVAIAEELPTVRVVALSGPSHAEEVARGVPTSLVSASADPAAAEAVQDLFGSPTLRVYTHDDVVGVEVGGALKNVIAVCAGICDGLGVGDNTKAALITRGLTEIARLGVAMGAREETFAGLTGVGDLIVTCMSMHSRNRRFGILVGKGVPPQEALSRIGMTVEGYYACETAVALSKAYRVEMPITAQCRRILTGEIAPAAALRELMVRPQKRERESSWL